jgi:hypothetical protein
MKKILIFASSFLFLLNCSKDSVKKKTEKKTKTIEIAGKKKRIKEKIKVVPAKKLTMNIPLNAVGWGYLLKEDFAEIQKIQNFSKLNLKEEDGVPVIFFLNENLQFVPVLYLGKPTAPPVENWKCQTHNSICYFTNSNIQISSKYKPLSFKNNKTYALINFKRDAFKPFKKKWGKIKKLQIGKLILTKIKDEYKLTIKPLKKTGKLLRNSLYYWKQLLINQRHNIIELHKSGHAIALSISNSKLKIKKSSITFTIKIDTGSLLWSLKKLLNLYDLN